MSFLARMLSFQTKAKEVTPDKDTRMNSWCDETFRRESRVDQLNSIQGIIVRPNTKSTKAERPLSTSSLIIPEKTIVEEDEAVKPLFSRSLDSWNPETCVRLLRMPSVQNYSGLRKLIAESSKEWILDFLSMDGLQILFDSVDRLSSQKGVQGKLENALLLLQCVSCFKAVVSSKYALEFITTNRKYAQKLAEVLCSQNPLVKKQLFELLSTLCIFSEDGHHLTLDVLESHRVSRKQRYRFFILLSEIKQAEVLPYVATLLALVNCIILGACGFRVRTRIRSEFLALGLAELLDSLKELPDEEVSLQCSVFDKSQSADQEHARSLGIRSSSSHFGLFQALLDKVEDTPHCVSFLILLQNLNQLDPNDVKSDYVWNILEEISDRSISCLSSELSTWWRGLKDTKRTSRGTQTREDLIFPNSIELENVSKLRHSRKDDDEVSVLSADSGVPVSRTQSWGSNDNLRSPSPQPKPPATDDSCRLTPPINNDDSPEDIETSGKYSETTNRDDTSSIFKGFSSFFSRSSSQRSNANKSSSKQSSKAMKGRSPDPSTLTDSTDGFTESYRSDTPIPEEPIPSDKIPKKKKSLFLNFSLFNKSKKYSLNSESPSPTTPQSPPPKVCVHPPSPDNRPRDRAAKNTLARDGITSIDLKRSRQRSQQHRQKRSLNLSPDIKLSGESKFQESENSIASDLSSTDCTEIKRIDGTTTSGSSTPTVSQTPPPPPPPPPPPGGLSPENGTNLLTIPSRRVTRSWSTPTSNVNIVDRPMYNTLPRPKSKMKTLNWAKIPNCHVNAKSIWAEINGDSMSLDLDFSQMEELFGQKKVDTAAKIRKQKATNNSVVQVSLLDSRRSLSIGIFLKQFKGGLEEILERVICNKHAIIGAERLRTLLHLLPDANEVKILQSYSGDTNALGTAEKFVLRVNAIENFESRVEGMLLLEEFPTTVRSLHDHVHSLLNACGILIGNEGLKNFLGLILIHGNFMNSGSYAGNAVGFRLSTLPKLLETRANHSRMTLLHYLVEVAQKKDSGSLDFILVLLQSLSKCSRLSVDSVSSEINHLAKSMNKLECAIQSGDKLLKQHFLSFVQEGKRHLSALEKKISEIQKLSSELAKRFCENENKFQLEECLSLFYDFCVRIKMVQAENQEFKLNEEKKKKQPKLERQEKIEKHERVE